MAQQPRKLPDADLEPTHPHEPPPRHEHGAKPATNGGTARDDAHHAADDTHHGADDTHRAADDAHHAAPHVELAPRKPTFMIAPRQTPGVQTFSADFVAQQLKSSPDIEVLDHIEPPRLLGLQSLDMGQTSSVLIARMAVEKARQLQTQAGARLVVEHDVRLNFGLEAPHPGIANPGVLIPLGEDFATTIEVQGAAGPIAGAEVYVFGSVWPTQGTTGADGTVTLTIHGDTPETIRALYVKPRLDHWDFWLSNPALEPNGHVTVRVQPIGDFVQGFPDQQTLGWGQRAMGLDQLPAGYDGAGIKIAIIDSGAAQPTHRNLHRIGPGRSAVSNDIKAWTADSIGHGSHCAGIIAGGPVGPNGVGIRGFAPAAEVHVIQIFPGGKFSSLIQAIDYCIENAIDVANLSLGGGEPSQIVEERLIRAKQNGTACIVAAGNSGGPVQFPASTPHVLAVAALGKWGEFPSTTFHATQAMDGFASADGYFPAKFSCFGPEIDVVAPGVAIISSLPDDGYAAWDGTSMAAPHVTGMAALVLAHHPDFKGTYANRDARRVERLFDIIKQTATPVNFGDTNRTGAGLPNVQKALGLEARAQAQTQVQSAGVGTADIVAMLRRLMQAVGADAAPQSVSIPTATPRPSSNGADIEWHNPPVARGPAVTEGAGLAPASFLPYARNDTDQSGSLQDLRNALRRAGLMAN